MSKTVKIPSNIAFYYKHNRLQQLRGFYYTVQAKSLTQAAKRMRLSQSAISLQIKSLEEDLKCNLMTRSRKGIELTVHGKALFGIIAPIIERLENLDAVMATEVDRIQTHELRIVANQAANLYLLPKLVTAYLQGDQNARVRVQYAIGEDAYQLIHDGEADMIIGPPSFAIPDDFVYTPIFTYEPILIVHPKHPLAKKRSISLGDIAKYPLILPNQALRTIKGLEMLVKQFEHIQHPPVEFKDWEIIKHYVEAGLGITIAASIALENNDRLVGRPLTRYLENVTYGVILQRTRPVLPQVRAFIDLMRLPKFKHLPR